jgi:hypothetical protein
MAASSGFYQSPGPSSSGNARGIVLAHCLCHQNGHQSWSIFFVIVLFAVALAAAGVIRSE